VTEVMRKGHVGQTGNPGQFASKSHAEADSDVGFGIDVETYNAAGTWKFPPRPLNADQHIAFWSSAEPTDKNLADCQDAHMMRASKYYDERKNKASELRDEFNKKWNQEHIKELPWTMRNVNDPEKNIATAKDRQKYDEWAARREAAWEEHFEQMGGNRPQYHPSRISDFDIRDVARAAKMRRTAELLPDDERKRVDDHMMPALGERVGDIWERYRCDEWVRKNDSR
jgi:hypothetical protein